MPTTFTSQKAEPYGKQILQILYCTLLSSFTNPNIIAEQTFEMVRSP